MRATTWFSLLFGAVISLGTFAGCSKAKPVQERTNLVACDLITGLEIEAVQGSPIIHTTNNVHAEGLLHISECFYTAKETNKSVSLAITQSAEGSGGHAATDYWKETFGAYAGEDNAHKTEAHEKEKEGTPGKPGEEEEKTVPPKRIDGLGDAAYWSGNLVGGALYVLKGDLFLRISLGGKMQETDRIERSKTLAQKALGRL